MEKKGIGKVPLSFAIFFLCIKTLRIRPKRQQSVFLKSKINNSKSNNTAREDGLQTHVDISSGIFSLAHHPDPGSAQQTPAGGAGSLFPEVILRLLYLEPLLS